MALQMTWQPSLLYQKRKNGPPLGLKNIGNTCYLNSVLQCLTYTPPLANFCLKSLHSTSCDSAAGRDCPFCLLEKRIARSLSIDQTLDTPSRMNNCLRIFADHFRHGRQEDAHEFLRYVIDACHNTCLRLKKLQQQRRKAGGGGGGEGFGESSTIVKEIFGGALQSQVKCLSCGGESNKIDEIMDISLDVLHCSSLKVSLQKFFQAEILDGNNKYKCESCNKLVVARKQMSLLQAPNILVIQLKRFEGIFGGKIDKSIEFEDVLLLSSYMCKSSQDTQPPEYNLFGTIVHSGSSLDSGHYYAYIKDPMGRWYCCNDAFVRVSNLQEVLSEKVYILFFSRTKQKPGPVKPALASNGVKFQVRNGTEISKSQKLDHSAKGAQPKQHAFGNDNLARSPHKKGPPTVQVNSSDFGEACTNNSPAVTNGKIISQRSQSNGNHANFSSSVLAENGYRNMPLVNGNGIAEHNTTKAIANGHGQAYHSANGNGITKSTPSVSVETDVSKDVTERNGVKEEVTGKSELANRSVKYPSDVSGSKRKLHDEDSCILFGKDGHSKQKVEELKESLRKEASSILRSCGWTDEVYDSMCSRKKLCSLEAGPSDHEELKKLLMTDAKTKFLSKIPESLKESLVKSLRSFSQQKQGSDA